MGLADHARRLVAYNEWANDRILDAARRLTPGQFGDVVDAFAHFLGTQEFWYCNWTGAAIQDVAPASFEALAKRFARSHEDMREFFASLTDEGWYRSEQWWKRWGYEQRLPLGETLFQVVNHATQHRSEIAVVTSSFGASPGDLDYLVFRQGR